MALIMDRHENLLHQVLYVIGQARKAPTQERPQMSAELAQELAVSPFVTGKTLGKQVSETLFTQVPRILVINSLDVSDGLQVPTENRSRQPCGRTARWLVSQVDRLAAGFIALPSFRCRASYERYG